jgi:IS5 family transposase
MKKRRNRTSKYVVIATWAYRLAKKCVPRYTHRNSPKLYTQPQLVACVLLGFYLNLSYRDLEDFLLASDQLCKVLELDEVPHYSTFCRAYQRLRMPGLRQLNALFLKMLRVQEQAIAVDATGLTPTCASRHYLSCNGRHMSDFIKAFYVIGLDSQYILGWHYARGPGGSDAQYLNGLRRQGKRYAPKIAGRYEYVLLADKGFDGIQAQPVDLIAPRQGRHPVKRPDRLLRLDLTGQARLDGLLGQRWKIETVMAVIKRKTGDALRSKNEFRLMRDVAMKALVYNLHRCYQLLLFWFWLTLQHSN